MDDWGRKFVGMLGYKLEELTGDVAPDARALLGADILATTPEKWDGVSRHWQQRPYVRKVGLVIIDESAPPHPHAAHPPPSGAAL